MSNRAITWAYAQRVGNPGRKAVLVALADSADNHAFTCYPSQATIAEMTEQSERAVRGHLGELAAEGYITRTPQRANGHRSSDLYTLHVSVVVGMIHKPKRQNLPVAQPEGSAGSEAADVAGSQPAEFVKTNRQNLPGNLKREPKDMPPAASKARRGTRLPEDWVRSARDVAWQTEHDIPDEFARPVTAEFKAYWLAKSGVGALKLDWSQAWKGWMTRQWRQDGPRWERDRGKAQPKTAETPDWMKIGQTG